MSKVGIWSVAITLFIVIGSVAALGLLSLISRRGAPPGIENGRLAPCSTKPNCVCSETFDSMAATIPSLRYSGSREKALETLKKVILAADGSITDDAPGYLAATFETGIFRFVDDVEFRFAQGESVIHVRFHFRVGYSDMGANRKRVELLATAFEKESPDLVSP